MKKTLYIGAKCVPSFYIGSGGSSEWVSGVPFEPLTVVTYNESWYISKIAVPASTTAPEAGTYWAKVPGYLTELDASFIEWAQEHIGDLEDDVEELQGDVAELKDDLNAAKSGNNLIDVTWERGTIDNSGINVDSNTAIRSVDYIDLSTDLVERVITTDSISVYWYFYDSSKNYITRQSTTVDGVQTITINATAAYMRFVAVTLDATKVKIAKNTLAVMTQADVRKVTEVHNQLSNGWLVFDCPLELGLLDTTTGTEIINNAYVRTDFINVSDYNIVGYNAPSAAGIAVFEYASDKSFVRRKTYTAIGTNDFIYHADTVYIRVAFNLAKKDVVKILQSVPFLTTTDRQQIVNGLRNNIANIANLSEKCIHHDNFSRTESGYAIGKNSEGALTDNSYDTVTGASSDDGVRVDDGLTIAADNTRSNVFTVRKIATAHGANFMVELNTPASGQGIYIIYKLTDASNFEAINISYNGTYYGLVQRAVVGGSFGATIDSYNAYKSTGYVVKLYFLGGIIAVFIDDKYVYSFYADAVDSYIYIGAYRGVTAHFDFINVFDMITPLVYNTEYLTDNNISALPDSTISANPDRYELDGTTTRFSNKSEHFMLYSTDEKINNGRRTERSIAALIPENLRTMRYEFDVLFPVSVLPDTASSGYGDIFFQLHDRQTGVSRGHVPFDLALVGNKVQMSQYYASAQASETLTQVVADLDLCEVTYDKWMHFAIYVHERYEERQHPFMEIKINGEVVYQSRKPNCANDVKGTSAQYGEYKNNFDIITYSDRYIDNFKVTY